MYVSFFYVRAESHTLHAHDPQLSFADEIIESPRGRKHIRVKIEKNPIRRRGLAPIPPRLLALLMLGIRRSS